jgi:hypothetical protein
MLHFVGWLRCLLAQSTSNSRRARERRAAVGTAPLDTRRLQDGAASVLAVIGRTAERLQAGRVIVSRLALGRVLIVTDGHRLAGSEQSVFARVLCVFQAARSWAAPFFLYAGSLRSVTEDGRCAPWDVEPGRARHRRGCASERISAAMDSPFSISSSLCAGRGRTA